MKNLQNTINGRHWTGLNNKKTTEFKSVIVFAVEQWGTGGWGIVNQVSAPQQSTVDWPHCFCQRSRGSFKRNVKIAVIRSNTVCWNPSNSYLIIIINAKTIWRKPGPSSSSSGYVEWSNFYCVSVASVWLTLFSHTQSQPGYQPES